MDGWVGGVEWDLGTLLLLGCGWLCNSLSLSQVLSFSLFGLCGELLLFGVVVVDHGRERERESL